MELFKGEYSFALNSPDLYDPGLPMTHSKAHGGTMIMWRTEYDPFVSILAVESSAFLPLLFSPPGHPLSIHIAVYLPTQGKENEFMAEIAKLSSYIDQMYDQYPEALFYLRGDFNVNNNNIQRITLLKHFCQEHELISLHIGHKTYHHFMGGGLSDSSLDLILFSSNVKYKEQLSKIICKLTNPLVHSHHDLLVSTWKLPAIPITASPTDNISAPRIENNRTKIIWSESGIEEYKKIVIPQLTRIQDLWLTSPSRSSIAQLISSTNHIFSSASSLTNEVLDLGKELKIRSKPVPKPVRNSQKSLLREYKHLKLVETSGAASPEKIIDLKRKYNTSKNNHRKLERYHDTQESIKRDKKLHDMLSKNPSAVHKSIRRSKNCNAGKIQKLTVHDRIYLSDTVPDGFYDSLSCLKSIDPTSLQNSSSYKSFTDDYKHIIEICNNGDKIPDISLKKSTDILKKIKPHVNDLYSITASHYVNAGDTGVKHFHLLLLELVHDVSKITITEINAVHANILFKGHGKEKTSDRSYRTISVCPLLAKALDMYVRDLQLDTWNADQSEVQFLGEGSSHELAALLLTETIQHSLFSLKKPVFALFLDAKSAFDVVLHQILVANLYHSGTNGHSLLLIDNRLKSRRTYIEWDKQLMGPIIDQLGVEQGGANSGGY